MWWLWFWLSSLAGVMSHPCSLLPVGLAVIGGILVLIGVISFATSIGGKKSGGNLTILLVGVALVAAAIFFGPAITQTCFNLMGGPKTPQTIAFDDFHITVYYTDNTTDRIPALAPQLFVTTKQGKVIDRIVWYAKVKQSLLDKLKSYIQGSKIHAKFWLFWNKPLTLGVTIWEKEVITNSSGVATYIMSYDELKSIVQQHAGAELLPSITGQSFDMDINIGVEVANQDAYGEMKYDHALKLTVSYKEDDPKEIEITDFQVSYVAQLLVLPNAFGSEGKRLALTPYGLISISSLIVGLVTLYLSLERSGRRRSRR